MKRFKQFLKEMPRALVTHTASDIEDSKLDSNPFHKNPGKYGHDEYHFQHHGYEFHSRRFKSDNVKPSETKPHSYFATHDHDDHHTPTHMMVSGGTTKDNHFKVSFTSRHSDCDMGADHMYKGILHHGEHKGIESDEDQTDGGASIWHRLAHQHSDVKVTRHDHTGKEVKLHKKDDWDKNFEGGADDKPTVFRAKLINKK